MKVTTKYFVRNKQYYNTVGTLREYARSGQGIVCSEEDMLYLQAWMKKHPLEVHRIAAKWAYTPERFSSMISNDVKIYQL